MTKYSIAGGGPVAMIALGLLAGSACNPEEKPGDPGGKTMVPGAGKADGKTMPLVGKELATKYLDCIELINKASWDQLRSDCIAPDYTSHEVGGPELRGADAVIDVFKDTKLAFPDVAVAPQLVLVNGRDVLAIVLTTGTQQGPLTTPMGELPATNKKVGYLYFQRVRFNEQNKAAERWTYRDQATMLGQLGQLPRQAGPTRPVMTQGIAGAPIVVVASDDPTERANLELDKIAADAFNAHKLADYMALWADDAVASDQVAPANFRGKKAITESERELLRAFPDATVAVPSEFAAGDYVVALGTLTGTNTGNWGKHKKTGKKVSIDFAEVYRVKDGKIAELYRFRSGLQMMQELGMQPMKPSAADKKPSGHPPMKP